MVVFSVSVTELLATASQRHVIPLQGRPYEEDQVTGMLTVEFQFKAASGVTAPTPEVEYKGLHHNDHKTIVNKPLGIMKTSQVSFQEQTELGAQVTAADPIKKGFSPYFDYTNSCNPQVRCCTWI